MFLKNQQQLKIHTWQAAPLAEAVSFINSLPGKPTVMFSLADSEHGKPTYEIVTPTPDHMPGIKCLVCGLTSFNKNDIEHKFCGKCNSFHKTVYTVKETTDIIIYYSDPLALVTLGIEFGRRSLAYGLGSEDTSKMQPCLPAQ